MTLDRQARAASRLAALMVVLLAGLPERMRAQQSVTVTVTADVSNTLLAVLALNDLAFGTVIGGTPVTINPRTSSAAGKYELHGAKKAQFNATFTLPAVLQAGAGGPTMPISFSTTSGCQRATDVQATCTVYDPHTALIQRIDNKNPPNDTYYVWLGGTVSPAVGQQAGVYQGTVTLSAFYTGL